MLKNDNIKSLIYQIKIMEAEIEVRTIQVNLKCPDCEIFMEYITSFLTVFGKTWKYKCPRCGSIKEPEHMYPYIKYVPK